MAQMKIPSTNSSSTKTISYENLLGVDYQSDATEVNRKRSPDMVNMISDLGGNPVKRFGYRRIGNAYKGFATVDGYEWAVKVTSGAIHAVKVTVNQYGEIAESSDATLTSLSSVGNVNHVFGFQTSLYVLCAKAWIEYNTSTATTKIIGVAQGTGWSLSGSYMEVTKPDDAFIPTAFTMYKPNGQEMVTLPSGTTLTGSTRGINILTPFRRAEYCVTADTASEFVFTIPTYKYISNVVDVEILDSATFEWKKLTVTTEYKVGELSAGRPVPHALACRQPDNIANAMANVYDAKITLTTAPYTKVTDEEGVVHLYFAGTTITVPAEQPNIRVTFAPFSMTEYNRTQETTFYNGYFRKDRCELMASSTIEKFDSRLFAARGVHTFYSRASEMFCIDDNYYFDVDNDVMLYAKTSSYLAVIGKDTGKNTIYLASGSYNESLAMTTYSVKASNAGIGAVSTKCQGTINDEPVFLANTGLYGIQTNYLSEKYAINRSCKINRVLCKEESLEDAVGISFNGYFYLAVNGHMYVLDSRHRDTSKNGDSSYECYYFDNMPDITDMFVVSNEMFFMDANYTYTWNGDIEDKYKYLDNATVNATTHVWSGTPVKAKWSSAVDGDGYPHYYKVLSKKGTMVTLTPQEQTSCEITLIRDGADEYYLGRFDGTKFKLSDVAEDAMTRKKVKKYKRLQFVVENNEPEPFGITDIIKTTTLNNYAKR